MSSNDEEWYDSNRQADKLAIKEFTWSKTSLENKLGDIEEFDSKSPHMTICNNKQFDNFRHFGNSSRLKRPKLKMLVNDSNAYTST